MSEPARPPAVSPRTVVALVLIVGVAAGALLAYVAPQSLPPVRAPCTPPPGCPPAPPSASASGVFSYPHVASVLAALALVALLALLIVFARTWRETRSPQILGIELFLVALLFQSVLTSPFVFARFGAVTPGLQPFLLAGQLFECVALLVFLYLSVQ
jgi:hypothetical protein